MCHVWPAGWIGPEITIIMCYVPSKLTILSKRARPKEKCKLSNKIWSGRKNNDASCQFGACTKVFSSPLIAEHRSASTCGIFLWFLVQCMVTTCFTPKMDTASSEICVQACFCKINRVVDHWFTLLPSYYCVSIRSFRVYSVWTSFVLMNS